MSAAEGMEPSALRLIAQRIAPPQVRHSSTFFFIWVTIIKQIH